MAADDGEEIYFISVFSWFSSYCWVLSVTLGCCGMDSMVVIWRCVPSVVCSQGNLYEMLLL